MREIIPRATAGVRFLAVFWQWTALDLTHADTPAHRTCCRNRNGGGYTHKKFDHPPSNQVDLAFPLGSFRHPLLAPTLPKLTRQAGQPTIGCNLTPAGGHPTSPPHPPANGGGLAPEALGTPAGPPPPLVTVGGTLAGGRWAAAFHVKLTRPVPEHALGGPAPAGCVDVPPLLDVHSHFCQTHFGGGGLK